MAKGKKDPNFPMQGRGGAMGGKYTSKSTNLSKSVLKRAGAAKAAAKRTVSISDTERAYGTGKTLGPAGKPLTGTVTLLDGKTAVYKNGRRVEASMAKPKASKPAASRPAASPSPSRPAASPAKKRPAPAKKTPARGGSALSMAERKKMQAKVKKTGSYQAGSNVGSRKATSATVSSAAAAGKKAGPTDRRTGAEKTYDAAKSVVAKAAPKRAGLMTAADRAKEAKKRKMVKDTIARYMASKKK